MVKGVTASERYLAQLCDRTFLRLWRWPNLYKDQGGGKEICDLLVVFDKHLMIDHLLRQVLPVPELRRYRRGLAALVQTGREEVR